MHTIPYQEASLEVWRDKHALRDQNKNLIDKDINATFERVAKTLAAQEKSSEQKHWEKKFLEAQQDGALCGGRITSNAGASDHKSNVSLINCTVSNEIEDSMEGILAALYEAGLTLKSGCGIGYEFSSLRPSGALVRGAGAATGGPLPFMDVFNQLCKTISSSGGRRGAQMATFSVDHNDVVDFIRAKQENGRLRDFNLSVLVSDKFIDCLQNDGIWEFTWKGTPTGKTIQAKDLWDMITQNTWECSEPGVLFIDRINRQNNLWFCENIRATNPCVTGDTVILTSKGYKRIDSLVGKSIKVWNGYEWSETKVRVTGRNQRIKEIYFSDGSKIPCTPYHTFVLKDGIRVEANDLQIGDQLEKYEFPVIEGHKEVATKKAYTQGFYSGDGDQGRNKIWLYEEKVDLLPFLKVKTHSNQSNERQDRELVRLKGSYESKDFVPSCKYTIQTRLDWLAGLIDSDGTAQDGAISIWSINKEFLTNVKYLLNTLGVNATINIGTPAGVRRLPNGRGGKSKYKVQDCYRLCINKHSAFKLLELGLNTHRVVFDCDAPNRSAARFNTVINIIDREELEDTVYCFTEKKNHTGIFNGVMTGQCGEQPLPPYGACLLGSINLVKFVVNPFGPKAQFNFNKMFEVAKVFARMLDNVVEISGLPLENQVFELQAKRRHGMGYLGLGSAMAMLGIKYGSAESLEFTEKVTKLLAYANYEAGYELAKEKGMAPILQQQFAAPYTKGKFTAGRIYKSLDMFLSSNYLQNFEQDKEGASILKNIKKYGCRFTHAVSIAPTGTLAFGIGANVSNGIEPSFSSHYSRNRIIEGKATKEQMDVYSYEAWVLKNLGLCDLAVSDAAKPVSIVTAHEITPQQHINVQASAQPWVDSSISKTINLPKEATLEQLQDVYISAYNQGLKGCTTYRPNPEKIGTVMATKDDIKNTKYTFKLDNGSEITVSGNEKIRYKGQEHVASNLYEAIKEGTYGRL